MALKKQMIIRKLEEEGVFTMNMDMEFPGVPQRIAIVSSKNAAGYSDFVRHLNGTAMVIFFIQHSLRLLCKVPKLRKALSTHWQGSLITLTIRCSSHNKRRRLTK